MLVKGVSQNRIPCQSHVDINLFCFAHLKLGRLADYHTRTSQYMTKLQTMYVTKGRRMYHPIFAIEFIPFQYALSTLNIINQDLHRAVCGTQRLWLTSDPSHRGVRCYDVRYPNSSVDTLWNTCFAVYVLKIWCEISTEFYFCAWFTLSLNCDVISLSKTGLCKTNPSWSQHAWGDSDQCSYTNMHSKQSQYTESLNSSAWSWNTFTSFDQRGPLGYTWMAHYFRPKS